MKMLSLLLLLGLTIGLTCRAADEDSNPYYLAGDSLLHGAAGLGVGVLAPLAVTVNSLRHGIEEIGKSSVDLLVAIEKAVVDTKVPLTSKAAFTLGTIAGYVYLLNSFLTAVTNKQVGTSLAFALPALYSTTAAAGALRGTAQSLVTETAKARGYGDLSQH